MKVWSSNDGHRIRSLGNKDTVLALVVDDRGQLFSGVDVLTDVEDHLTKETGVST